MMLSLPHPEIPRSIVIRAEEKTVYGEVEYSRRVYQTSFEDGKRAYVYLLDKSMQMDKIGMTSTNLAEKITMTVTESPYRVSADMISSTCGQSISAGGVWLNMQDEKHKK